MQQKLADMKIKLFSAIDENILAYWLIKKWRFS